jgi:uncharacterized protein involved in copper resistance
VAAVAAVAFGACATQVNLPALPDCHPANPDAPTTARVSPSPLDSSPIDHGAMDHGAMGHGAMDHGAMDHGDMEETATVYACPMHPEIRSDGPDQCPICGMALTPVPEPDEADEPESSEDSDS